MFSTEEKDRLFKVLAANKEIADSLLSIIKQAVLSLTLIDSIYFAKKMGLIDEEHSRQTLRNSFVQILDQPHITVESRDLVCGYASSSKLENIYDVQIKVTKDALRHLEYADGIKVFECLKITSPTRLKDKDLDPILSKLLKVSTRAKDRAKIQASLDYLIKLDSGKENLHRYLKHILSIKSRRLHEEILEKLASNGKKASNRKIAELIGPFLLNKKMFGSALKIVSFTKDYSKDTERILVDSLKKYLKGVPRRGLFPRSIEYIEEIVRIKHIFEHHSELKSALRKSLLEIEDKGSYRDLAYGKGFAVLALAGLSTQEILEHPFVAPDGNDELAQLKFFNEVVIGLRDKSISDTMKKDFTDIFFIKVRPPHQ